jgi:hypothetical protein
LSSVGFVLPLCDGIDGRLIELRNGAEHLRLDHGAGLADDDFKDDESLDPCGPWRGGFGLPGLNCRRNASNSGSCSIS